MEAKSFEEKVKEMHFTPEAEKYYVWLDSFEGYKFYEVFRKEFDSVRKQILKPNNKYKKIVKLTGIFVKTSGRVKCDSGVKFGLFKEENEMAEIKLYVLGDKNIPEWVMNQSGLGRIKFIFDEFDDMKLIGATIHTPTSTENAVVGDAIIYGRSGLSVKRGYSNERKVDANVNIQKKQTYKAKPEGIQQNMDE